MTSQQTLSESEIDSAPLRRSGSFRGLPLRAARPVVQEKELNELLNEYEEACDSLQVENATLEDNLEQVELELATLRQKLESSDVEHKKEVEALRGSLAAKDSKISELEFILRSLKPQLSLTDPSASVLNLASKEQLQSLQHTSLASGRESWFLWTERFLAPDDPSKPMATRIGKIALRSGCAVAKVSWTLVSFAAMVTGYITVACFFLGIFFVLI